MKLCAIVLTKNEAIHIQRCIESARGAGAEVLVVDSFSTDITVDIALELGATVVQHHWVNYATQMNWAIDQVPNDIDWILRLDADEEVSRELSAEIRNKLPVISSDVDGIFVKRRMCFLGKPIRWGGVFPITVLRLFRPGKGRCEERWMDEHITVPGATESFKSEIVDDNKKSLTWWTEKHNSYASREVVDILNHELNFMPSETIADLDGGQAGLKRWIKEHVYSRLPSGLRALGYFAYRYWLRLGFLDGKRGALFHVLQGYWYRYLVDAKLYEVKRHMKETGDKPEDAIKLVLGIDVIQSKSAY